MNPNKLTLIITFILLVPTLAFALTLEEYVSNLDTSYYDGTINITIFNDEMIDNNSNSINDTLIFNITTDNATSDTFTANIFFNDMTVPSLSDTRAISSSNPSFYMNISTFYLTEEKYTYFVRIYNQIGQIVYESRKINTSDYFNYETGTNLIQITDENLDNDFIRINLTINVTKNEVVNISVNLEYNNSVISATKEVTLTTPTQLVSIDFDNETIKSTHYNGMYNITSVIIEDKIIETEQLTSSYDYEDFAETSYIKNISSQTFDNNSNNLSEALQFNFTLNIKSVDTYTIESDLYDLDDNYITTIAKNETLSTGTQIIVTEVAGGDIYSTYYNGEFKLSFTKLSIGNNTKDIVYNAHTTNITYYTEFERPPLSDLAITMNASFSEADNKTNITINITNRGEIPAFNIFVDIFDDSAYENQSSVSYLDVNKSQIFNFIASNKTTNSIFTAITDFDNYVDESNESNNIIQNIEVSLSISSLKTLYADDTTVIFEFIILNDGNFQISDISWAFMPGDGYTINSTYNISSLTAGESALVYIEYDYPSNGSYTATANATGINAADYRTMGVELGGDLIIIDSFKEIYSMGKEKVWEIIITNTANQTLTDINWQITGTDSSISSTYPFSLTTNESIRVYIHENLSNYQDYTITAKAFTSVFSDTKTLSTHGKEIEVSNLKTLYTNSLNKTFEFLVTNTYTSQINDINWSFYTGESTINSNYPFSLTTSENIRVLIENQYSSPENYNINASVKSSQYEDSENKSINV